MDQIVGMVLKMECQLEGICEVSNLDKGPSRDDTDALFPEVRTLGQLIDGGSIPVEEIIPHDVPAGEINKIPIVAGSGVL